MSTVVPAANPVSESTVVARLAVDPQAARDLSDRLSEIFDAASATVSAYESGGGWTVAIHFVDPPNETAVRALVALAAGAETANVLVFEKLAAKDWVKASLDGLAPVAAGRFVVHGDHDRSRIRVNRIGIEIAASLAFGTGHHGTTQGCLLALDALIKRTTKTRHPEVPARSAGLEGWQQTRGRRPSRLASLAPQGDGTKKGARGRPRNRGIRILDIGTGTGVLAIAAARALRRPVLASDVDPKAVRIARENARHNRAGTVTVIQAAGLGAQKFRERGPFDLVLANILLGPLQRMATPMTRLLAPGARVVLSGLLTTQASAALAAYRAQGLALDRRIVLDGWATLVLRRGR